MVACFWTAGSAGAEASDGSLPHAAAETGSHMPDCQSYQHPNHMSHYTTSLQGYLQVNYMVLTDAELHDINFSYM